MKRLGFAFTIFVALLAGAAGNYLMDQVTPEEVEAQARPRAGGAIRVAVVDLERVCRQSRLFKERKIDWEKAQDDIRRQNEDSEREYKAAVESLNRARLRGDGPDVLLPIQVEIKAMEEAHKVSMDEQKAYLQSLLNEYQKEVLQFVMDQLRLFVNLSGYDVVMQDYSLEADDAGFFEGGVYSQILLSKSVLYIPGGGNNPNQYVTDITDVMVDRVKNLAPPPKKKEEKKEDKDD